MTTEPLTTVENYAIKWQMFSQYMENISTRYENGDITGYDAWEIAVEKYKLFS